MSEPIKELYKAMLEQVFVQDDGTRLIQKAKCEKELETLNDRINSITDKFADGDIEPEFFHSTRKRYDHTKHDLLDKLKSLVPEMASYKKHISFGFSLIENLSQYYVLGDLTTKQKIISSIFKEKLVFDKKNYRTTEMNEVLALLVSTSTDFKKMEKKRVSISADLSTMAPPSGLEPETL